METGRAAYAIKSSYAAIGTNMGTWPQDSVALAYNEGSQGLYFLNGKPDVVMRVCLNCPSRPII